MPPFSSLHWSKPNSKSLYGGKTSTQVFFDSGFCLFSTLADSPLSSLYCVRVCHHLFSPMMEHKFLGGRGSTSSLWDAARVCGHQDVWLEVVLLMLICFAISRTFITLPNISWHQFPGTNQQATFSYSSFAWSIPEARESLWSQCHQQKVVLVSQGGETCSSAQEGIDHRAFHCG